MIGRAAALLLAVAFAGEAQARITPEQYRAIAVTLPDNASLPLVTSVTDESGRQHSLADFVDRPTVFVFADYACRTLCGPAVAFVADALEQSGLRAGEQFRLVVMGLGDGAEGAGIGTWREHLRGSRVDAATAFLTADHRTIAAATAALGYHYRYDPEAGQYIHPAAAFVLRADGKVSRVLTELGLTPQDLRLALIEASEGRIGTLGDQVRLICSAFDPRTGGYTLAISRVLAGAGGVTVLLLVGGIVLLSRAGRGAA